MALFVWYLSLAHAKLNGYHGFINKKGKVIVPFIYSDASFFKDGLVMLKNNSKWGFLDTKGKTIIPFEYDYFSYTGCYHSIIYKK